jgi:hypothetical protein
VGEGLHGAIATITALELNLLDLIPVLILTSYVILNKLLT